MTPTNAATPGKPLLVAALGVGLFAGSMGIYMVPLQIGALMDGLGIAESQAGLLGALEVAAMALTSIAISPRMASWSRSKVAFNGVMLAALCELLTIFILSPLYLYPLRLGVGVGCGCVFASVCASSASSANPDRSFGMAQAVMNCLFFILFMLVPYTLAFGPHQGLFAALALILVLTSPLYRYYQDAVNIENPLSGKSANIPRLLACIHILATILLNVGLGALWGFAERIGKENVGLSSQSIGTVLSLATLFMIAGSLFAAWLGTRLGRAVPMATASILCAIAAMMVTSASTITFYAGGLFLYNFAYLFLGPYTIAGIPSLLDPGGRLAAAMGGIMFFSYSLGIAAAGFIAELVSLAGIGTLALLGCLLAAPLFALVSVQLERPDRC